MPNNYQHKPHRAKPKNRVKPKNNAVKAKLISAIKSFADNDFIKNRLTNNLANHLTNNALAQVDTLPHRITKLHQKNPALGKKLSLVLSGTGVVGQSLAVGVPLFALGLTKLAGQKITPLKPLGDKADNAIVAVSNNWIAINNWLIDHVLPQKNWTINLPDRLDPNKKYLLICNHQSWVDTSIIQYISQDRLPLTRFFTKYELIYLPVVGQAFYLLDFPMMKRHTKAQIAKNPALAGQDLLEAERACRLLSKKSFVLLNYLEGTRFSAQKHADQNSPYRYLLKPKAGGLALALASLGESIDGILDMTIVYPDGIPSYDELWAGQIERLSVDIRFIDLPKDLLEKLKAGQYQHNLDTKKQLHEWLHRLWQQKDERIHNVLQGV